MSTPVRRRRAAADSGPLRYLRRSATMRVQGDCQKRDWLGRAQRLHRARCL